MDYENLLFIFDKQEGIVKYFCVYVIKRVNRSLYIAKGVELGRGTVFLTDTKFCFNKVVVSVITTSCVLVSGSLT